MKIRLLFCAVIALGAHIVAAAEPQEAVSGTLSTRAVELSSAALAKMLGGAATDVEKVFALPMEKLLGKGSGAAVTTASLRVSGAKARVDGVSTTGTYLIADSEHAVLKLVDPREKRYVEITKEDVDATRKGLVGLKAVQDKLAKLPEEQRRKAESMFKKIPSIGSGAPAPSIRPLEKSQVINGFKTKAYEVKSGGETTVGWVSEEDSALAGALRTLKEKQEQLMAALSTQARDPRLLLLNYGLPVRVQTLGPRGYRVHEISGFQRGALPEELFAVPAGLTKTTAGDLLARFVGGGSGATPGVPTATPGVPAATPATTPAAQP